MAGRAAASGDEHDDLVASRARIVASSNAARRALERRLHDGPQQHLVAMAVKLRLIENVVDESPEQARQMLAELRGEVQEAVQQLRDIASAIFPPLLSDRGLAEALQAAAGREGGWAEIAVHESASGRYPIDVEAGVYFAALDAMHRTDGPLELAVHEDGADLVMTLRGDLSEEALLAVEDRVHTVGGSTAQAGDTLVVRVPTG